MPPKMSRWWTIRSLGIPSSTLTTLKRIELNKKVSVKEVIDCTTTLGRQIYQRGGIAQTVDTSGVLMTNHFRKLDLLFDQYLTKRRISSSESFNCCIAISTLRHASPPLVNYCFNNLKFGSINELVTLVNSFSTVQFSSSSRPFLLTKLATGFIEQQPYDSLCQISHNKLVELLYSYSAGGFLFAANLIKVLVTVDDIHGHLLASSQPDFRIRGVSLASLVRLKLFLCSEEMKQIEKKTLRLQSVMKSIMDSCIKISKIVGIELNTPVPMLSRFFLTFSNIPSNRFVEIIKSNSTSLTDKLLVRAAVNVNFTVCVESVPNFYKRIILYSSTHREANIMASIVRQASDSGLFNGRDQFDNFLQTIEKHKLIWWLKDPKSKHNELWCAVLRVCVKNKITNWAIAMIRNLLDDSHFMNPSEIHLLITSMMSLRVRHRSAIQKLSSLSISKIDLFSANQLVAICTSFTTLSLNRSDQLLTMAVEKIKNDSSMLSPIHMEAFLKLLSPTTLSDQLDSELCDDTSTW